MRAIVLCRHGATQSNIAGRFLSRTDDALSPLGLEQCRGVASELQDFAFAQSLVSPMLRCLQTREIIAPAVPFQIEPTLREVDFGLWEGRTLEWIEAHDADALAQRRRDPVHFRPSGGESFADVAVRLAGLAERLRAAENVLVIGHRGTLGVLERLLRDLPLDSQIVKPLEPAEFRLLD